MLLEVFVHPQCHVCHRLLKELETISKKGPSVELRVIDVEGSITSSFGNSSASTEGLPSVSDSHTIASLADATAANLTALAQHSLGQLDHVARQGFTLGQSNRIPNIGPVG